MSSSSILHNQSEIEIGLSYYNLVHLQWLSFAELSCDMTIHLKPLVFKCILSITEEKASKCLQSTQTLVIPTCGNIWCFFLYDMYITLE